MLTVAELAAKLRLKLDEESWKKGEAAISGVKGLLAGIGLTAAAARGVMEALIAHTAAAAIETSKAAQRVGMAREEFQGLDETAKHSGVESFEQGIKFLNRSLYDATHGSHELRYAFRQLGVEVGRGTKVADVLPRLIDAFSKMRDDDPRKVALAMRLFGRAGNEMLPFLNQGNAKIAEMIEHAHKLGIIFSDEDVTAANEYRLANLDLKMSLEGLERTIGRKLLPEAGRIARAMADWIAANREWIAAGIHRAVDLASVAWKRATTTLEPFFRLVKFLATNTIAWKAGLAALTIVLVVQFGHAIRDATSKAWDLWKAMRAITSAQALGAAASILTGLAWAAGIGLILLAVEELYGWITGDRETLLERWLGKFSDFMNGSPGESDFAAGVRTLIGLLQGLGASAKFAVDMIGKLRRLTFFDEDSAGARALQKIVASDPNGDIYSQANNEADAKGLGAFMHPSARQDFLRQRINELKAQRGPSQGAGSAPISVTLGDINVTAPAGSNPDDFGKSVGDAISERLQAILDPAYEAVQR